MSNDSNSLVIANDLFRHKRLRSVTKHKGVHCEHSFILVQKRYQSSLDRPRARAFPRIDIESDFDLLMAIMKVKLLSQKIDQVTRTKCCNFDKLKYPRILKKFQTTICRQVRTAFCSCKQKQ